MHPEILRPPVVLKFLSYKILTSTKRISIVAIFSLLVPNLVCYMCLTMPKCTQKNRNKYAYFTSFSLNFPTKLNELELTRVLSAATETCFRVSIQFSSSFLQQQLCDHSVKHGNHFWSSIQLYFKASKRKMVTEFSVVILRVKSASPRAKSILNLHTVRKSQIVSRSSVFRKKTQFCEF